MVIRTTLAAILLAAIPLTTTACPGHDRQTQSCIDGEAWDAQKAACVPQITG